MNNLAWEPPTSSTSKWSVWSNCSLAADYRQGHIVESINLPLAKLPERIAELERYRDKPVVLVCKFGQSANGAAKSLKENGFTRVFKLGGGISEWQGSQLPLVRS